MIDGATCQEQVDRNVHIRFASEVNCGHGVFELSLHVEVPTLLEKFAVDRVSESGKTSRLTGLGSMETFLRLGDAMPALWTSVGIGMGWMEVEGGGSQRAWCKGLGDDIAPVR